MTDAQERPARERGRRLHGRSQRDHLVRSDRRYGNLQLCRPKSRKLPGFLARRRLLGPQTLSVTKVDGSVVQVNFQLNYQAQFGGEVQTAAGTPVAEPECLSWKPGRSCSRQSLTAVETTASTCWSRVPSTSSRRATGHVHTGDRDCHRSRRQPSRKLRRRDRNAPGLTGQAPRQHCSAAHGATHPNPGWADLPGSERHDCVQHGPVAESCPRKLRAECRDSERNGGWSAVDLVVSG